MDLPLESADFIRLFSEWSTLTPEGRIARNQNLVTQANSNILMTQVSAKSPRIPTSISENLEIYNQWETYLTNFTEVKASNMSPVAQSGLDSVYESSGYAWPLLQAEEAVAPSLQ